MAKRLLFLFYFFSSLFLYPQPVQLDTSFGANGKARHDFGLMRSHGRDLMIQQDGKILVGGYAANQNNEDYAILRFSVDGSLDTTFGNAGTTLTNFFSDGDDKAFTFALRPDDKFYLGGISVVGLQNWSLAAYLSNGKLDSSVLFRGTLLFNVTPVADTMYAIAIQSDSLILLGGWNITFDFCIIRFLPIGIVPDLSFGEPGIFVEGGGKATIHMPSQDRLMWMLLQEDGKIIAGGGSKVNQEEDFSAFRLHSDGSLDSSFANLGVFKLDMGFHKERSISAVFDKAGKILMAGTGGYQDSLGFNMIRLSHDGLLDTTFGDSGIVRSDFVPHIGGKSIALFPDGKILAVGSASNGTDEDFILMRFMADGKIDSTFGQDGKLFTDFNGGNDQAHAVSIDTIQEIIALAGETSHGNKTEFALAKYVYGSSVNRPDLPQIIRSIKLSPNPLSDNSTLSFELSEPDVISVAVYDIEGREIMSLIEDRVLGMGPYEVSISMENFSKGVYLLRLTGKKSSGISLKMVKSK